MFININFYLNSPSLTGGIFLCGNTANNFFNDFVKHFYTQSDVYRSIDDIKSWENYTSYQKEEMLSFCDFLFNEGHYERCLIHVKSY